MGIFTKCKEIEEFDRFNERIKGRCRIIESFAQIGESLFYLGIKVTVIGYHTIGIPHNTPSLNVKWIDKNNNIYKECIRFNNLNLCKKITRKSNDRK